MKTRFHNLTVIANADDPVRRDVSNHVERSGILDAPLSRGMTAMLSGEAL
jgi:hypothetical protein